MPSGQGIQLLSSVAVPLFHSSPGGQVVVVHDEQAAVPSSVLNMKRVELLALLHGTQLESFLGDSSKKPWPAEQENCVFEKQDDSIPIVSLYMFCGHSLHIESDVVFPWDDTAARRRYFPYGHDVCVQLGVHSRLV